LTLPPDAIPVIPRGVRVQFDKLRDVWVLLAPERAITLDQVGHAILSEIDGTRDFAAITKGLAEKFGAPLAAVETDSAEFIGALVDRRFVDLRS